MQNLFEFPGLFKILIFLVNLKFFVKNTEVVPRAGIEPARPFNRIPGFSYHFDFHRRLQFSLSAFVVWTMPSPLSIDVNHLSTLGAARLVSTRSFIAPSVVAALD